MNYRLDDNYKMALIVRDEQDRSLENSIDIFQNERDLFASEVIENQEDYQENNQDEQDEQEEHNSYSNAYGHIDKKERIELLLPMIKDTKLEYLFNITQNDLQELNEKELQWFEVQISTPYTELCSKAIEDKNLKMLKWLYTNGGKLYNNLCSVAVEYDCIDILKFLNNQGYLCDGNACSVAVKNNNLQMLKYIHETFIPCPWGIDVCYNAIKNNRIDILKFAVDNGCPLIGKEYITYDSLYRLAIENRNLEIIQYLYDHVPNKNENQVVDSAGNIKLMKWFIERGFPLCKLTYNNCIYSMPDRTSKLSTELQKECIQYLLDNHCPYDEKVCFLAAETNFELLQWLHEKGFPWNEETCVNATSNENPIEVLSYLRKNNCPWDSKTFAKATSLGDLTLMSYLFEENCPWDSSVPVSACCYGKIDALQFLCSSKWLEEHHIVNRQLCPIDIKSYEAAARNNKLNIIKWLHEEYKLEWGVSVFEEALNSQCQVTELLDYLYKNKCPIPDKIKLKYSWSYSSRWIKENHLHHILI